MSVAGDLSITQWDYGAPGSDPVEVLFSDIIDLSAASKGLLKNREDVLALLNGLVDNDIDGGHLPLLCQVVRSDGETTMRLFTFKRNSVGSLASSASPLNEVLKYRLPRTASQHAEYELHTASGTLFEHVGQQLRVYDMTGTTPRVVFELGKMRSTLVNTFARISSSCLLAFSNDTAAVYETKFGSVLGSLTTSSPLAAQAHALAPSENASTHEKRRYNVVSSFSDVGLVVVISGNKLLGLQVSEAMANFRLARSTKPSLVDVLGKGAGGTGLDIVDPNKKQEGKQARWEEWKTRVDDLVQEGDIDALESFIANDLGITSKTAKHGSSDALPNGLANGHTDTEQNLWTLPFSSYDPLYADGRKANYVLGKLFAWRPPAKLATLEPYRLELVFKSRNILRWLARMGLLTASHLQQILPQSTDLNGVRLKVVAGEITAAIERIDQGFLLICDLISLPIHWDLAEVMQGLRLLIRSLEDPSPLDVEDVVMDEADVESRLAIEEAAAHQDIQRLASVIEDGPLKRSEALRMLIGRLQAFSLSNVTKCMRKILSHHEIIFLIRVLLIELYEGGWTSLYVDTEQDEHEIEELEDHSSPRATSQDYSIYPIANLLICAVDAVGINGWLVGLSGEPGLSDDLIDRLRVQISAAITGCLESQNLDLYLSEICRSADSAQRNKKKRKLPVENLEDEQTSAEDALLPLGGVYEPPVIKSGGRKKKSSAEQIGKYTFEKLRW